MAGAGDKAFEVFVKRAINSIQREGGDKGWGRSKEAKDLTEACTAFLSLLEAHEAGVANFEGSLAVAVLQPLSLACANSNPKVVELALGCLHKLVAHAWLHGESSMFEGLLDDGSDVVSQVIKLVVKCGESSAGEALQLSVIRALLTFTTAEHFVAHGDCLMAAVRTVFNLALGSEADSIKRTACNALLQMLNTVAKRITCSLHHYGSLSTAGSSNRTSDVGEDHTQAVGVVAQQHHYHHQHSSRAASSVAAHAAAIAAAASASLPPHSGSDGGSMFSGLQVSGPAAPGAGEPPGQAQGSEMSSDARTAQFASLAEQSDLRGLEAAIGASAGDHDDQEGPQPPPPPPPRAPSQHLPSPAPSLDLGSGSGPPSGPLSPSSRPSPRPAATSPPLQHAPLSLAALTVMERDVLQVLTAFCKLASRESGLTEVESFLHQGKLLALELLAKVLHNPQHMWDSVRDEFCRHLTQPLCITLLRNCSASDPATFQLAIKLLVTVMLKSKLRRLLKAELGAFYPLYVLRPLETGRHDLHTLYTVLNSVRLMCCEPQLLVDIFVNYDCDLQAPCLYERTVSTLSSLARMTEAELERPQQVGKQQEQAARVAAIRDVALKSLLCAVASLEAWAAPIREAHTRAAECAGSPVYPGRAAAAAAVAVDDADAAAAAALDESPTRLTSGMPRDGELERLEAVHSRKSMLAKGLSMFNASPVKGVRYLLQHRCISAATPAAVAAFLLEHHAELDLGALGEYFGHHEDFSVAVMHAWIDAQPSWAGVPIDGALRLLLAQFRLPGEAQKIDRIMEKFAERFVRDNPGRFATADGAYMLAFAIIMLNTDAHNPLAERRLGKLDFVAMNSQPVPQQQQQQPAAQQADGDGNGDGGSPAVSSGGVAVYQPVLPAQELEGIYDRIVHAEIKMRDQPTSGSAPASAPVPANRLAAALGLRALAAPFRPMAGAWGRQQQGLSEADRKRRLVQLAERAVLGGGGGSSGGGFGRGAWHSSSHPEHARPMLTVTGGPLLEALTYSLAGTKDAAAAAPLLTALVTVVELSALLGLEELCETCLGALAKAAGLSAPAPYGSPDEGKLLAALRCLLGLAASPVAGLLGSGWTVLLHSAAQLDALVAELAASVAPTQAALPGGGSPHSGSGDLANPFNKMFQALGFNLGGAVPGASGRLGGANGHGSLIPVPPARPPSTSNGGSSAAAELSAPPTPSFAQPASPSFLRPAPGAGLALWALSPDGVDAVSRLYRCSAALDGESVVVFFRALCAVSREELESSSAPSSSSASTSSEHASSGGGPRLYSLQRLLDCAHANAGRIRLIRSKLWAVTSAHLVMVACHSSQAVAVYAVNALHGLAARLLARAELLHFTQQEEALRPFVSVLRVCDDPEVRRLAVRSALGSCAGRAGGLGSGWRTLLELLRRAAADPSAAVAAEAAGALQAVVDALYRPPSTTVVADAAAANGHSGDGSGGDVVASQQRQNSAGGGNGSSTSTGGIKLTFGPAYWLQNGSHEYFQETVQAVLASAQNPVQPSHAGLAAVGLLQACGLRLAARQQQLGTAAKAAGAAPAPTTAMSEPQQQQPSAASADSQSAPSTFEAHWSLLLECLAGWAAGEQRPAVAEAASQAVLELMQAHGAVWGDAAWRVVMQRVLPRLLSPTPAAAAAAGSTAQTAVAAYEDARSLFISRASEAFPGLCDQVPVVPTAFRGELLAQLSDTCLSWFQQDNEGLACLGLRCFELLARRLAHPRDATSWGSLLGRVAALLMHELDELMQHEQGAQALSLAAAVAPPLHRQQGRSRGGGGSGAAAAISSAGGCRARMVLLMQRLLVQLHQQCMAGMPWRVQAQLAALLVGSAKRLQDFNTRALEAQRHAHAAAQLHKRHSHGGSGSGSGRANSGSAGGGGDAEPGVGAAVASVSPRQANLARVAEEVAAETVSPGGSEGLADRILDAAAWGPAEQQGGKQQQGPPAGDVPHQGPGVGSGGAMGQGAESLGRSAHERTDGPAGEAGAHLRDAAAAPRTAAAGNGPDCQSPHAGGAAPASAAAEAVHHHLVASPSSPQRQPDVVLSSAESRDGAAPSLGRLESEAAAGAMAVLGQCLMTELHHQHHRYHHHGQGQGQGQGQHHGSSGKEHADAPGAAASSPEESPQQLLSCFCLHIITSAASAAVLARSSASNEGSGAVAAAAPLVDAAAVAAAPPLEPWHCILRALNLAQAIQIYLGLPDQQDDSGRVVRELWPSMVALIGSPHAAVRHAVSDFFLTRVAAVAATACRMP